MNLPKSYRRDPPKMKTILDLDLLSIARCRKHLTIATSCFFLSIVVYIILLVNSGQAGVAQLLVMNTLIGLLSIWVVVASVLIMISLNSGVFSIVLGAIVAIFLPWLVGIALISQATTVLKLAGAKSGLLGLSQTERDKITPGHCRGCGYDRTGLELLQECPECRRVPQVI